MSNDANAYPPSVLLGLLYERTSAKGKRYFAGRLGAAKIAVVPAREPAEDGTPMWRILVSEAPPKQDARPSPQAAAGCRASVGSGTSRRHSDIGIDGPAPSCGGAFDKQLDDEIPF